MRLAYVAGRYRDPRGEDFVLHNILRARKVAIRLWQMGFAVFCPHTNTAFMGGAADDSVWLAGDREILSRCDLIVMLPGWEYSEGASEEHVLADTLSISRYYWPQDRELLAKLAKQPRP